MSYSQAGVYSLKLYENKDFTFLYDTSGQITLSSISNTGDVLELTTNDNFIKYANALPPADNNIVLNDHSIAIQINGLIQSNLDLIEKLQSSIYGWIPVFEFMDNQISLINVPFFPKTDKFNSQVSHTWFEELKPRIFTTHRLKGVFNDEGGEGVQGLLDFDGIDDYVGFASHPDVSGTKTITFNLYVREAATAPNIIFVFNDDNNDNISVFAMPGLILAISASSTVGVWNKSYDLTSFLNQKIDCRIEKSTGVIDSFYINNILQISIGSTFANAVLCDNIGQVENLFWLKFALIWDIAIDGIFTADGQPAGNLAPAWSQSIAATVNGSPSTIDLP